MAFDYSSLDREFFKAEETGLVVASGAGEQTTDSSTLNADVSDSKFFVELEVTETSAVSGNLDVRLRAAPDDSTYSTVGSAASLALNTTGTNKASGFLDATGTFAPYWKFQVFTDGTDMTDSATVTLRVFGIDLSDRVG